MKGLFLSLVKGLFILSIISATDIYSQPQNFRFRHLTVDNGLSHTDATSIVQDENGFIWIGTYSGLDRYDGYTTKIYYNNVEGNQTGYLNRIADMQLYAKNCLWLATEGGLALFDPSVLSFKKIKYDNRPKSESLFSPLQKIIVAGNKLFCFESNTYYSYTINPDLSLTKNNVRYPVIQGTVFKVKKDSQNKVWISHTNGITLITKDDIAKRIVFEDAAANMVTTLLINKADDLFISNQKGLFMIPSRESDNIGKEKSPQINLTTARFQQIATYPTGFPYPNDMQQDNKGDFWLTTTSGLKKFIVSTNEFASYSYNEFERTSLASNSANSVFIDISDCLWVTTFGGGVNIADLNQKSFQLLQRIPNSNNTLSANYVRALLEDEKENLWIGTRNNGLNYYDFNSKTYTQYHTSNSGLQSENIRSLAKDKDGRLWVGTDLGISVRFPDGSFDNLQPKAGDPNSFVPGNYFSIAIDKFNQAWAGTWNNGLSRIVYTGKNKYTVQRITAGNNKEGLLSNRITFIYTDNERPEVLVGTDHGLNHIFLNNDGSIAFIKNYHSEVSNTLSSEFVWPLLRQGDSVIWVGTLGGGLNKIRFKKNGQFEIQPITDNNVQALRDVESMLMDKSGNLWLAGKLLAMYNPSKNEFVYYDVNDGLQGNSFKIGAAYKGSSGRLYFGGTNGVNYFDPAAIVSNKIVPSVVFTELIVNGESVEKKDGVTKFIQTISYLDKLQLLSSQNNFSVQFSAMHFANPERCKYRYRLEGYDKNWIYTDASNRFATYSNLDYGSYKLKVEAANNDGVWVSTSKELKIILLAPWWKTTWAKIVYLLLLAIIIYIIWKYQNSWFNLKRELQYKELEEKKQEELHQMKLQFFTNISHEFRTPLTLIMGPTEKMMHHDTPHEEQQGYLRLIYSNARRLLGLTNELMDFRKVETDNLKLRVSESNLDKFVFSIGTEFRELANEKNITYDIRTNSNENYICYDPDIMEKVLVNLISNAFKYTDSNGTIEVEVLDSIENFKPRYSNHVLIPSVISESEMVWIRVADTGIGITSNSIRNIFDRYFRVNTTGKEKHLGTGVGLALVKSLVVLHKGALHVYSERNKGSEFMVGLPVKKEVYKDAEISNDADFQIDFENLHYTINWINDDRKLAEKVAISSSSKKDASSRKRILVVEDNSEMRKFLLSSLNGEYDVIEASDGVQGLKMSKDFFPDLIISDLMMPEMDGNEFSKAIRADLDTSHIPFILITAKSSDETHLEGLESGADVFLPKPFSLRLLHITIHNLFEQLDKLKSKYSKDVFAEARELVNNDRDKEFLNELIGIIEENMEDEELDVDMICRKIGMSRTKLYGKVKGVTGQPIGEFIRVLRLKRAAKLLVSEDIPILEVMFQVGIQSQSYFTKAFKKEFGKTPSQFISDFSKNAKGKQASDEN